MKLIKRPTDIDLYKQILAKTNKRYLAALAAKRGISRIEDYLVSTYEELSPPETFVQMPQAVALIMRQMQDDPRQFVLHCDYDCDGLTSAYIFVHFIRQLTGMTIQASVNDRETEGYGLSVAVVDKLYAQGYRFILTADNGISSIDAVTHAKRLGMTVVVSDHHEPKKDMEGRDILPPADAIICHKAAGNARHPMGLCGAATIWFICRAIDETTARPFIDAAGMATVVDMVSLCDPDNRIMVKNALTSVNNRNFSSTTLKNLFATVTPVGRITEENFGFGVGPLINSAGRMGNASSLLSLLTADATGETHFFPYKELNEERKKLTDRYFDDAQELLYSVKDKPYTAIVLPDAPEGILGLIASKLENRTLKPTFVFTPKEDGTLKGSARSRTLNLQTVFDPHHALPVAGGGHKEACGLSLAYADFPVLLAFLESCEYQHAACTIDGEIDAATICDEMISQIEELSPFGVGFEKPLFLFHGERFDDIRTRKEKHLFFRANAAQFICFNYHAHPDLHTENLTANLFLGKMGFNHFNGMSTPQVTVERVFDKSAMMIG